MEPGSGPGHRRGARCSCLYAILTREACGGKKFAMGWEDCYASRTWLWAGDGVIGGPKVSLKVQRTCEPLPARLGWPSANVPFSS